MNEPSANPVWVALLCVARCLIPFLLLLAISYIVRKLGLVAETPPPPEDANSNNTPEGGFVHGSI